MSVSDHCLSFSYFPFGFEGMIWDLIVSVPDHCLFFFTLNPSKALGPNELHPSILKELATEYGPVFLPISSNSLLTRVKSQRMVSCKYMSPL